MTTPLSSPDDLARVLQIPFSDEQLAAATAPMEPSVILAGAGTGKTTVMAARVVWLVGTGQVAPSQVLGLTFTRKAAGELSARVRDSLARAGVGPGAGHDTGAEATAHDVGEQLVLTYDAFAAQVVAEHGLRAGVEADARLLTGAARHQLATRVVRAAAGPFQQLSRLQAASVPERVLALDNALHSHLVEPDEVRRSTAEHRAGWRSVPLRRGRMVKAAREALASLEERLELLGLVEAYGDLKRELGLVEFADQMAVATRLAEEHPSVGEALRDQFRVVLLDEFQDTSSAQGRLLQALFGGGHPVTAVGDPFQAIYVWRGAAPSNITRFAGQYPRADGRPARRHALTVNRRSGPLILDVANRIAGSLRVEAAEAAPDDVPARLRAPESARPASVEAACFVSRSDELGWVAERLARARATGELTRWSQGAVLCRTNNQVAEVFSALTAREIPVEIVGLGGLLALPEIQDVTATLTLLEDVTAVPEAVRLLTGPRWRIGPSDLERLARRAHELAADPGQERQGPSPSSSDGAVEGDAAEHAEAAEVESALDVGDGLRELARRSGAEPSSRPSLVDALADPGPGPYSMAARRRFAAFSRELAGLARHRDEPVGDLTRRVVATLGLDVEMAATPEYERTGRRAQLATFLDAVAGFPDLDGDGSLSGLLSWLRAERENGVGLERSVTGVGEAVQVLTAHRAKGLEWDVVVVPTLADKRFPKTGGDNWLVRAAVLPADLRGDADSIPQVQDHTAAAAAEYADAVVEAQRLSEDRLAYVTVTRARRVLVGTWSRWREGRVRPYEPSPYWTTMAALATEEGTLHDELTGSPAATATTNPLLDAAGAVRWPAPLDPEAALARTEAARRVDLARILGPDPGGEDPADLHAAAVLARWDDDLERLMEEARRSARRVSTVDLPDSLTASQVMWAHRDPEGFARHLARPMPQAPSSAAVLGTRFHAWVERHLLSLAAHGADWGVPLVDDTDLGEAGPSDRDEGELPALGDLVEAFREGDFGQRVPDAVEAPFSCLVDGIEIRGRIDAVYSELDDDGERRWLVVDWKTGPPGSADALQLAVYRLAWSDVLGVDPSRVSAAFHHVHENSTVVSDDLRSRRELAALVRGLEAQ